MNTRKGIRKLYYCSSCKKEEWKDSRVGNHFYSRCCDSPLYLTRNTRETNQNKTAKSELARFSSNETPLLRAHDYPKYNR